MGRKTSILSEKAPNGEVSFPWKLHRVLEDSERYGFTDIVSWNGRCSFKVHDQQKFEKLIMEIYFNRTRYESFRRQLNIYGFKRITNGSNSGSYTHQLFVRGKVDLCRFMIRTKIKNKGSRVQKNRLSTSGTGSNTREESSTSLMNSSLNIRSTRSEDDKATETVEKLTAPRNKNRNIPKTDSNIDTIAFPNKTISNPQIIPKIPSSRSDIILDSVNSSPSLLRSNWNRSASCPGDTSSDGKRFLGISNARFENKSSYGPNDLFRPDERIQLFTGAQKVNSLAAESKFSDAIFSDETSSDVDLGDMDDGFSDDLILNEACEFPNLDLPCESPRKGEIVKNSNVSIPQSNILESQPPSVHRKRIQESQKQRLETEELIQQQCLEECEMLQRQIQKLQNRIEYLDRKGRIQFSAPKNHLCNGIVAIESDDQNTTDSFASTNIESSLSEIKNKEKQQGHYQQKFVKDIMSGPISINCLASTKIPSPTPMQYPLATKLPELSKTWLAPLLDGRLRPHSDTTKSMTNLTDLQLFA